MRTTDADLIQQLQQGRDFILREGAAPAAVAADQLQLPSGGVLSLADFAKVKF